VGDDRGGGVVGHGRRRPGAPAGERVDVVDHRAGPAHESAEDPTDLRQLERALHERDEGAERDDEQDKPEDHRQHRDELAAGPVALAADGREREQRVGRGRRGKSQAPDHDGIATQPRREPGRVGGCLYLRGDEHRREDDAGERDHAGRQRAEDLLRGRGDRRAPALPQALVDDRQNEREQDRGNVRCEHRNPHRRGEPKTGAQEAAGSQAVVHGAPPAGLGTTSAGSTWTPARAASSLTSPIAAPAPIRRIMRNG
jgi:hypothetical protein